MKLSITNNKLRIELSFAEKFASLKNSFEIPLKNIRFVSTKKPKAGIFDIRAPGTYIPGLIRAGTYFSKRGREFWFVKKNKNHLIIELADEKYTRIILSIENNKDWERRIKRYIIY